MQLSIGKCPAPTFLLHDAAVNCESGAGVHLDTQRYSSGRMHLLPLITNSSFVDFALVGVI